jgi:hypothetical protein
MSAVEVGQVWTRKVPAGDGWDSVTVVGVQAIAEQQPDEFVLRAADSLETVQATAEDLQAVFTLAPDAGSATPQPVDVDPRSEWA